MIEAAGVEQRYGVVDGAQGHAWVVVPDDREEARALRDRHNFWCSTLAGGCGVQLSLRVGDKKIPHFSHYPGQTRNCPFAYDLEALERSYLHLALQHTLRVWLERQGFSATLEHTLADRSRADLYVRVAPGAQTIEVQLSPLSVDQWEERTRRYTSQVDKVTWLFGPHAGRHLLTTNITRDGYALAVKLASNNEASAADPATIQIGTVSRSSTQWAPLTACSMTQAGITTPFLSAALVEHESWQAIKRAAEQKQREKQARADSASSGAGAVKDHTTFRHPKQHPQQAGSSTTPRAQGHARVRPRGAGRDPSGTYGWLTDLEQWNPPGGWGFLDALDPTLRQAVRIMAYIVSRIEGDGPDWTLSFPDLDDDGGAIEEALAQAGLIELYDSPSGLRRWRRNQ